MNRYDPTEAPLPSAWLALTESERLALVEQFHIDEARALPSISAHAAIHAAVETQLALNIEPVVQTMGRVISEGLSRHEAIHAIGYVLAEHLHNLMQGGVAKGKENEAYYALLKAFTIAQWHGVR